MENIIGYRPEGSAERLGEMVNVGALCPGDKVIFARPMTVDEYSMLGWDETHPRPLTLPVFMTVYGTVVENMQVAKSLTLHRVSIEIGNEVFIHANGMKESLSFLDEQGDPTKGPVHTFEFSREDEVFLLYKTEATSDDSK